MWELYKSGGNSFEPIDAYTQSLLEKLKKHDYFSYWHCCHVAGMVGELVSGHGLEVEVNFSELIQGAVLHDIGKLYISSNILKKNGILTEKEHGEILRHPQMGEEIVRGKVSREVGSIILYHHERCHGTGYPFGVEMRDLPLYIRLVGVADCFCAMTEHRSYGKAYTPQEALAELRRSNLCQETVSLVEKALPYRII